MVVLTVSLCSAIANAAVLSAGPAADVEGDAVLGLIVSVLERVASALAAQPVPGVSTPSSGRRETLAMVAGSPNATATASTKTSQVTAKDMWQDGVLQMIIALAIIAAIVVVFSNHSHLLGPAAPMYGFAAFLAGELLILYYAGMLDHILAQIQAIAFIVLTGVGLLAAIVVAIRNSFLATLNKIHERLEGFALFFDFGSHHTRAKNLLAGKGFTTKTDEDNDEEAQGGPESPEKSCC